MTEERFKDEQLKVSVVGLDLIFKVLCLIAKIMIYRLPVNNIIDILRVNNFKEELKELQRND